MKSKLQVGILLLVAASVLAFSTPQRPLLANHHPAFRSTSKPRRTRSPLFLSSYNTMPTLERHQYADESHGNDAHRVKNVVRGATHVLHDPTHAAKGMLLTAIYISVAAFTSGYVRGSIAFVLARFPAWVSGNRMYSTSASTKSVWHISQRPCSSSSLP